MRKTIIVLVAAIVLVVAGVVLWRVFNPGPLAFAGGASVPLADYHAAKIDRRLLLTLRAPT